MLIALYAAQGGVGALVTGLGPGTIRTAGYIETVMPSAGSILLSGLPVVALAVGFAWIRPGRRQLAVSIAGAIGAGLFAAKVEEGYRAIWYFAEWIVPASVAFAAVRAARNKQGASATPLMVVASMLALHALHQFPYAAPNYFGYVAPLALVLVALMASEAGIARRLTFVATLLIVFGGWFHRIGSVGTVGLGPVWWDTAHRLAPPHGGLLVTVPDSATYARLGELTTAHGGADSVAAGPEFPALYALAGTRRLVAQPYLIVPDARADSATMAATLDLGAIRAVAINRSPMFLPPVSVEADRWLASRFPFVERVGNVDFRWR
jgi:hypothetical protein